MRLGWGHDNGHNFFNIGATRSVWLVLQRKLNFAQNQHFCEFLPFFLSIRFPWHVWSIYPPIFNPLAAQCSRWVWPLTFDLDLWPWPWPWPRSRPGQGKILASGACQCCQDPICLTRFQPFSKKLSWRRVNEHGKIWNFDIFDYLAGFEGQSGQKWSKVVKTVKIGHFSLFLNS